MQNQSTVSSVQSSVIPFSYESKEIRTIKDASGNPWWVAKDICDILEIKNVSDVLSRVPDKHKGIDSIYTLGGVQKLSTVDEPGLYRLILRSDKPQAEPFMEWVTSEVLPQIRKTGAYSQLPDATLSPEQQRRVQNAVTDNVYTFIAPGRRRSAGFAEIYRKVKDHFLVGSYKDVPARRYEELLTFIERLDISKVKLLEESTQIDEAAIAVRITAEIMKRLPAIAQPAPVDTQPSWKQLWPMLEQSTDTLGAAIQQLLKEITDIIPGGLKNIPAGSDPMNYIRLHYSEMEKAARQLCILAELLMWRSPKVLNFHAALGDPRY